MPEVKFPTPYHQGPRLFFRADHAENYVRGIAGLPLIEAAEPAAIRFIPCKDFMEMTGLSKRTINFKFLHARLKVEAEARPLETSAA